MKIAIDGYEANVFQRLGSSRVAFELLKQFAKDRRNEYTVFLPNPPLGDLPPEGKGWKYRILKPRRLWTRIALPLALYFGKEKYDLIFSPTHYIPRFSPIKRIATIFDLSFLHFSQTFTKKDLWQLSNWTKFSVRNADHLVTISNFSKKDIIEKYRIDKNKVTVAYPGYDKENFKFPISNVKLKKIKEKYKTGETYIIYIGTIQPRKNLARLIEAFAKVARDLRDVKLVIVGKSSGEGRGGWMYKDILDLPKKLQVDDRIEFSGFVPAGDLPPLLTGALGFVLPSLWEGFGIPVLEAMACGTPVIVSNESSMPEVVGSAGLLIDPYSVDQIEQAIRTLISDKKLREKYSRLGIKQAGKFSWEKMAKTILKEFERVAS